MSNAYQDDHPAQLVGFPSFQLNIPNELLDRIVAFVLAPASLSESMTKNNNFAPIASFTLVSTLFRQVALRRYFHSLCLSVKSQWDPVSNILGAQACQGGYTWVRVLHIPSEIVVFIPDLIFLKCLQILIIDFEHEGLATQHPLARRICKCLQPLHNLTSLTLTTIPRIDTALLSLLVKPFPGLTVLSLSSTERLDVSCCWSCFQESASCTVHSPIPDMFAQAADLADAFANTLKPLAHLTHLHLGIFLSSENIFYSHLNHDQAHDSPPHAADECLVCYGHPNAELVRDRELEASIIMAQKLKALRSVGWSTLFGDRVFEEEGQSATANRVGDWKRTTTMSVLRKDGRVWVRRGNGTARLTSPNG